MHKCHVHKQVTDKSVVATEAHLIRSRADSIREVPEAVEEIVRGPYVISLGTSSSLVDSSLGNF